MSDVKQTGPISLADGQPPATSDAQLLAQQEKEKYRVGTLQYTKVGLFVMFFWILWGDLVFTLMERVFPAAMPLQLRRLGIPVDWTAVLMITLAQAINMTLVPIISFRSDRTRSRWGRRMPYIAVTMPFLCASLFALGHSDDFGAYIRAGNLPEQWGISPVWMLIPLMGVLIVLFDFFNVFVNSVYWYLFADVVPTAFMGRFMAAFRLVGQFAGAMFSAFIFGRLESHTKLIYYGSALMYLVGFSLMMWRVKEGKYPPPNDYGEKRSMIESVKTYFHECFTHPVYVSFYLSKSLWALADAVKYAQVFFYLDYLKISLDAQGKINSIVAFVAMGIALPVGWLVDWVKPMRAVIVGAIFIIPLTFAGYWMNGFTYFVVLTAVTMPFTTLYDAADMPMMVALLPKAQYGQFASANATLRAFTRLFSGVLAGRFLKYMKDTYGDQGYAYSFMWQGSLYVVATVCLIAVYFYWRKYGGDNFKFDLDEHKRNLAARKAASA